MTGHEEYVTDTDENRLSLKQSASITERPLPLAYGLRDAPGQEFEEYVADIHETRLLLKQSADMVEWASLFDYEGDYLADTEMLT